MKIDSHQHFWNYSAEAYDWIDDSMASIRRDFDPGELKAAAQGVGITGSVAVQARQSLEETHWLLDLAATDPFIRGVVGWVPLASPAIATVLDSLAHQTALRGVRHVVQGEPDPEFLAGDAFNRGIRTLAPRSLVYDLLITAPQLPASIAFIDRHPAQPFILDHIAKPVIDGPPPTAWVRNITELARRPHVTCKFSGVVTEVRRPSWTPELLAPYFDVVLNAFGSHRLMFGSDWPVCLVRSEYDRWFQFVESCASSLSHPERTALFGGNAMATYRLNL